MTIESRRVIAATGAEENNSNDSTCLDQFADSLPGWLSRLGLNLDVHACGVLHTADGNNTTDRGDASSIYWTMTGFSDRPRVYEAIAFPAGTPAPSGSLIQQYDGWSNNAARIAEEESSDSARFSAFVEAMSGSLNSSGKNFGGTSFSYCTCDGSETYTPADDPEVTSPGSAFSGSSWGRGLRKGLPGRRGGRGGRCSCRDVPTPPARPCGAGRDDG
ncbi:hypothetical protein NG2371_01757 [Nocardia gamkensis]|nr:hypothetical protein [Nocardia gamkensis]